MEPLGAALAESCPSAFTGASGALFMQTVTALVAAHCGIIDDYSWPKDEAEEILNAKDNPTFDFIIVGAGTAGSILASRLSSNFAQMSVLLIEAGDDPGLDSEIPALLFLNQDTDIDWHYKTYPNGKRCLGFNNSTCIWSKGRAMGGSSSINAMLYIRGHQNDYDKWNEDGKFGWTYKDLELYFQKIESKLELHSCNHENSPWYDTISEAWKELGFKFYNDSGYVKIGTRITKLLTRDGKRLNTAKLYLKDRRKANLHVMKNSAVQKIIIDSNMATGVVIRHSSGKVMSININREVILSAGSIATPQILMLSGIGPKKHLEENHIKCAIDLPVGKNLQDHILLPIYLKTNIHTYLSQKELSSFLLQYMMSRTGPFSNIGITDFMGFIDTKGSEYPNIQFHHSSFVQNDTFMLKSYLKGVGYTEEIIELIVGANRESNLLSIYPTLLHPKSFGEILLFNNDPKSKPIIKSNYFDNPEDLELLIESVNFIRKLVETKSFKAIGTELIMFKIPNCLKYHSDSKDYWKCYIRHMATTIYHPVGTTKMGPKQKDGVVNRHLLVHGMRNLRVADASIMPSITSGNTMAPTMVIAEKAADIIKGHYRSKDEL